MRMTNPKSNMPLLPPGSRPKRPIPPNSSGPKPIRPPKGGVMPMAMGGTVKVRPTSPGDISAVRPGENYFSGKAKKFPGKPMLPPGKPTNTLPRAKMAMGGTVQSRPKGSSPRPGEKPFSPGMPKLPRIKMAMGGMTLRPGDVTNKLPRVPGGPGRPTNKLPRVPGGPGGPTNTLPRAPGMKSPMGMKHGGMAHGTKAKKGRGMAIMIAIGKPKGRGKS